MLDLARIREFYPQYAQLTDYELTKAVHAKAAPHQPFEQFAQQFGGPTEEDAAELGARQYNAANPDNPITADDIRAKDRSGFLGSVQLLGEGIWDAVTDQFPEDMARIWRGGDIDPQQQGVADKVIERQKKDSAARIPSLQEVEGDTWANSLYQGPRSVATSLATGVSGSLAGGAVGSAAGPAGNIVGSMVGAATMSFPAFYRMAKDQFVEEVQEAVQKQRGTPLSSEEARELNALIDADAVEFGFDEAAPEALSQFLTAGLLKGGGGAFLKRLGLGGLAESIGKRALTRIPAKLTAEIAEEEATEAMTFMGQEGIRKRYNLRKTDPTLGEFVETQAGPVAVGSLLQMGVGGAINRAFGRSYQQRQEGNIQQSEDGTTVPPTTENPQPSPQEAASGTEQPAPNAGPRPQAEDFGLKGAFGGQSYQDILRGQQAQGVPADRMKPGDPFDDGYEETAEWVRQNEQRVGGDNQRAVSDPWDMTRGPSISSGKTVDLIAGDYGENAPAVRQPSAMYGMNFLNQNAGGMDVIDVPYKVIPMPNAPQSQRIGSPARIPLMAESVGSPPAASRPLVTPYDAPSGPAIAMPSTAPVQGVVGGLSTPAALPAGGVPMQTPRGDTTAQARQVGMPVPESLPQGSALPRMSVPSPARQPMERPASVVQAVMPAQNTPEVRPVAVRDARSAMQSEQEAVRKALWAKTRPRLLAELPEGAPVTLRNASKEKIVDWLLEHADTRQSGQEQAESVPETSPSLVESGAQDRMETQEQVASRGEAAGQTPKTIRQEGSYAERETVRNAGRDGNEGSTHAGGFLQGERRGDGAAADLVGDGGRGGDGGRAAQSAPQGREGGRTRQPVAIKIPNRADEPAHYELLEADDVRASHLPARGFQKNPAYGLENERRYHDEPASQAKVMENAARLDPAFLMDSVDANHGAPVVDQDNNVLGGNGRAMSIARAYESFPERGGRYREALKANAERLGIDSAQVDAMRAPVLVRRLERGLSREERQGLVTAMNDDFKDARERRASGKSRGDRFGRRTLDMLAAGLKEAESLRQYFDTPASAAVVERMMRDGVIQPSERNALVGSDGLLNPDGKKVVEEALRGRVARSYEALAKLPADVVGKLDAAIPHILVAESIGKPWDITEHVKASVDLLAAFKSSGSKDADLYLKQLDMRTGRAPVQDYTKQAIALFRMALDAKKSEYVKAFEKYASNARMSPEAGGMPGVAKPQDRAFRESFRMEEEAIQSKPEKVKEGKPQAKETSEGQPPEDAFGPAFPAFSGKPHEAIEHLMEVREGHVPAAFHKEGLGDIDLPWGKEGKKGFGLAHIIERRNDQGVNGVDFVRQLPNMIQDGSVEHRENYPNRAYIVSKDNETVIRLEWDGKRRAWLLTAYLLEENGSRSSDRTTDLDQTRVAGKTPPGNSESVERNISSEKQAVNSEHSTFLADRHRNLYKSLLTGKATLEEYRRGFSDLLENEEAVRAELSGLTVKDLLNRGGAMFAWRHKGNKKADLVDALYRDMLSDFTLGQPYSVSGFMGMGAEEYRRATEASIRKIVDAQTERTLSDFAKSMAEQRQEYASRRKAAKEAVENPKTLDDFRSFMRFHMDEGKTASEARDLLSFEQRERFDRLAAEAGRSSRKTKAEPVLSSASQTTGGEIIATKHTQKGHDLFVVRLEDRVSREDYLALLSSAKKLGGYYSKFRGNGAVPGFQFTEREQAEAFLKLAQGDKADAQEAARARRDAFEDDRSQTAVQRLHEMADRLDEDADASLSAARKVNTAKRARQAASADATAYANKSLARTMRNIARAIEEGTATFLDRVREKRQVELLRDDLRLAKWEEAKAEYSTWDEREKHREESATSRTVEYAAFPHYRLYRSGWAELGRKLMEKDGTKNLGKKILSVADDVTETYLEFARGHLEDVSTYATRDGNPAVFKSREDAEKAIARSGYHGKAVVLPVKRGENRIILSPSAAQERGVWEGDDDRMITLRPELVDELFDKLGNASRDIPWQLSGMRQKRKALARMGIETPAEYRTALREFIGLQEEARQDKVRELDLALTNQ